MSSIRQATLLRIRVRTEVGHRPLTLDATNRLRAITQPRTQGSTMGLNQTVRCKTSWARWTTFLCTTCLLIYKPRKGKSWPKTIWTQSEGVIPNNLTSAISYRRRTSRSTLTTPRTTFSKWCPSPVASLTRSNNWVKMALLSIWRVTPGEATARLTEVHRIEWTYRSRLCFSRRSTLKLRRRCSRINGTKRPSVSSQSLSHSTLITMMLYFIKLWPIWTSANPKNQWRIWIFW